MVTVQKPFELDEIVNAETNVGEWRSLYPGIPAEVVMGICGPWSKNTTARRHASAMQSFLLMHGFLNLGIERTRALEEARRIRLVSVEAQKIMTKMKVLLLKKDRLTEALTNSDKMGQMTDAEIEIRHKELAGVGTELNRLDDILTGKRDERLWMSAATQVLIRGALYNRGLFDGKPAGVRLPYSVETHPGYIVPDGEVHLVWVTETVGGDRRHIVVHAVLWKERLADWVDKTPVGYGMSTGSGPTAVDHGSSPQVEQTAKSEEISFGPPEKQGSKTENKDSLAKTIEEILASQAEATFPFDATSTLSTTGVTVSPPFDATPTVSSAGVPVFPIGAEPKRKVLTPEQLAIKKARFDDRIRRAKEKDRLERLRKREEREKKRLEKKALKVAGQPVGDASP